MIPSNDKLVDIKDVIKLLNEIIDNPKYIIQSSDQDIGSSTMNLSKDSKIFNRISIKVLYAEKDQFNV